MASFSIPLTGLNADQTELNTIANNISNLNTTGFKSQSTSFEDLFYQQVGSSGSGDPVLAGQGVKVARTHGGAVVDPDSINREVTADDLSPVRDFVSKRMNGLDSQPVYSATCMYTNSPDLNFVVGQHPSEPKVTIVSACSGHGFKFASVLGEIISDMTVGGKVDYDVAFMSPDRFERKTG